MQVASSLFTENEMEAKHILIIVCQKANKQIQKKIYFEEECI